MIGKLSGMITKWLLRAGAISSDDEELYEYAAYTFLFNLIPFVIVTIVGLILHMFLEGVLLILPFILARKFSGGFHLQSPITCFISSTAFITAAMLMTRYFIASGNSVLFSTIVLCAFVLVFMISPVDSETRKLSDAETRAFRKIARIISGIITAIYFALNWLGFARFAISIGGGVVITGILQIPCLIQTIRSKIISDTLGTGN